MKKAEKIVNSINTGINRFFDLILFIIKSILPSNIKNTSNKVYKSFKDKKDEVKNKVKQKVKQRPKQSPMKTVQDSLKSVKNVINKTKEATSKAMKKVKVSNMKEMTAKKVILFIVAIFTPLILRSKLWILSLKPATVVGFVVMSSVGTLTSIQVYNSAKTIADETKEEEVVEVKNLYQESLKRAEYYNEQDRHLDVSNVTLPVYIESVSSIRSLTIDFTMVMSNRYLRAYFLENEHLLKNRINNTLEPIIPDFPLNEEGKIILRDKIKYEVNELIRELKIKGQVNNVLFDNIIAG